MNILILNWRDSKHPLAGGAEVSLFEHAKYWVNKGATVTWFCSSFKAAAPYEIINGITIIRKGSHFTVHIHAFLYAIFGLSKKPDIIIDSFHFIPFFSPFYISKKKIIALINEPAKNAWFKNIVFPLSLIGYLSESCFFSFYKHIPFITSALSIVAELQLYGIQQKNIHLISHGIQMRKLVKRFTKQKNVVVYLAQITEDKGIKDAVLAFALIKKEKKDVVFWVIGKAPDKKYEEEVKILIASLGIQKDVSFLGYVSENTKMALLEKATVLIHPSIREGWGLNIIEANTVGTPAVGYNVTGLRDSIVHNHTGLLTEKNTPHELAASILMLLSDTILYKKLSVHAVTWSKTFNWEKAGEKSWELLNDVYTKNSV